MWKRWLTNRHTCRPDGCRLPETSSSSFPPPEKKSRVVLCLSVCLSACVCLCICLSVSCVVTEKVLTDLNEIWWRDWSWIRPTNIGPWTTSHFCPQTPDGRTDGRLRDFIFCPMHSIALDRQQHKVLAKYFCQLFLCYTWPEYLLENVLLNFIFLSWCLSLAVIYR